MSKKVRTYRTDEDQDALIRAGARREGLPKSAFVRRAALDRAARVIRGGQDEAADGQSEHEEVSP